MKRMQKFTTVAVFCVCLGFPLSAVPQERVAGCPVGIICLTQQDAAAIVQKFNQMAAMLDRAAAMIEERDKAIAELRAKQACI